VLEPAEQDGPKRVLTPSHIYYWTRLNQNITTDDFTFREALTATYERPLNSRLGVIRADAERQSPGAEYLPQIIRVSMKYLRH
jgi:hypothetical protein